MRYPWKDFPEVVRNGDLGDLKKQPEYVDAKAGDEKAAFAMARRLVCSDFVKALQRMASGYANPVLLPVLARESTGNNKIPIAFALVVSEYTGWGLEENVYQTDRAFRTNAGADHRLAIHPAFGGDLMDDVDYIILDDTLTMGGTLADLRGFVMEHGGRVIGAAVAVAHPGAVHVAVKPGMLTGIQAKHGPDMDHFWRETYGYGIECLTQGEAGHLRAAQSVDAIRNRIATARHAHFDSMDARRIETASLAREPSSDRALENGRNDKQVAIPAQIFSLCDGLITRSQSTADHLFHTQLAMLEQSFANNGDQPKDMDALIQHFQKIAEQSSDNHIHQEALSGLRKRMTPLLIPEQRDRIYGLSLNTKSRSNDLDSD